MPSQATPSRFPPDGRAELDASNWTRRAVLAAGFAAPALSLRAAAASPRVAALDWGLAATVAALGAGPGAVAERAGYDQWVREPPLPGGVVELGLRTAPSFEALSAAKPDLILINALNTPMRARLERIAPVYANTIFSGGQDPVERAVATARELGARLDRVAGAEALVSRVTDVFAAARVRLAGVSVRPVVPLGFIDARHARVYGAGSLFEGVMARVGLFPGWTKPTNAWGFSVAAVEALAACRDADLLVIEPVPTDACRLLDAPSLWSSLVAANGARVTTVPPIWAFGDITAAARCAALLADAFSPPDAAHG